MKKFVHCAFNNCGKPCGHYYPDKPGDTQTLYSWCWLRGQIRYLDNGNTVDYTYYCCEPHFLGKDKRGETDSDGEELE